MRIADGSMLSILWLGLVACPKPVEVCADNMDNDRDGAVDCSDSECAMDASCQEEDEEEDCDDPGEDDEDDDGEANCDDSECSNHSSCEEETEETDTQDTEDTEDTADTEETDTEDTSSGGEICDDADGNDEDEDGDANCADADCARISSNCDELQGFIMIIDGITSGTTSFTGSGTSGWERYDFDYTSFLVPKQSDCHIGFDVAGTPHQAAADCTNCEFAFLMEYSNSTPQNGVECDEPYNDLHDSDGSPYSVDGNTYGFGYDPAYAYNNDTLRMATYYSVQDGIWVPLTTDLARTGTGFSFAMQFSNYLYYY
jgi:hypothetical protein